MTDNFSPLKVIRYLANVDLSSNSGYAVQLTSGRKVQLANDTSDVLGILDNRPAINEVATYVVFGSTVARISEAVIAGASLSVDTDGRLRNTVEPEKVVGYATQSGSANDMIEIFVDLRGASGLGTAVGDLQTEVNNIETSVGLNADGTLPAFTGTEGIDGSLSHREAIEELDANVGEPANVTAENRTVGPISDLNNNAQNIDLLDQAIGPNVTSTNYIDTSQSVNVNLSDLDAQLLIASSVTALPNLSDVANDLNTGLTTGQFLRYDGVDWDKHTLSINDNPEVTIGALANGDILYVSGGVIVNALPGATSGVQPYDAGLTDIAALAVTNGNIIVGDGANWVAESGATARASLGLTIGTDVQAQSENLQNIANFTTTPADGTFIVGDGANFVLETASDARSSLGLVSGGAGDIWVEKAGDTMSGALAMGTNKVTTSYVPVDGVDLVNKTYVDNLVSGLDVKDSVRVASTANINLASATDPNPIDGVTLSNGDSILLKDQSTGAENGIYTAVTATDPTTWVRRTDADSDAEVTAGMFTFVEEGTVSADTGWILTTNDPIIVDTTALTFTQFSGSGTITAGVGLGKSGNTLFVNLGAGIVELPSDEVGIDLYDSATGALILTSDGTNRGTATGHALHLLLDGSSLVQGASGLKIAGQGVTETELHTSVAGDGLVGGNGTALAVNPEDTGSSGTLGTLSINADKVGVDLGTTGTTAAAGNHNHDGTYVQVAGDTMTDDLILQDSGSLAIHTQYINATTGATSTDGFKVGINSGEAAELWNYEATDMLIATSGTERVRITDQGSVTIQTPAGGFPTFTANLQDNLLDAFLVQQGSNKYIAVSTVNTAETITIGNSTTNPEVDIPSGKLELGVENVTNGIINVPESLFINIDSNGDDTTEKFVIAKDRTTTSGGTELWQINETGEVVQNSTSTGIAYDLNNAVGNHGLRVRSGNNEFNDGTEKVIEALNGTSGTSLFAVHAGGNVGIGPITAPTEALHVEGNLRLGNGGGNRRIDIRDNTNTQRINIDSSGVSYFNGGNVGIGTSSPNSELDVNGAISLRSNVAYSANQETAFGMVDNQSVFFDSFSSTNGGLLIRPANIGTSANASAVVVQARVENDPTSSAAVYRLIAHKHNGAGALTDVGDSGRILAVTNNNTEILTLQGSGSLGVNQTDPNSWHPNANNLVVGDTSADNQGITIVSGSANSGSLYFADSTAPADNTRGGISYDHASNTMSFRVDNALPMYIESTGFLNLGTTGGDAVLNIKLNSSGAQAIDIIGRSSDNASSIIFRNNANTTNTGAITVGSTGIAWASGSSGATKMLLDTSGNLVVGDTTSEAKLDIASTTIDSTTTQRIRAQNGSGQRVALDIQVDGANSLSKFLMGTGGGATSELFRFSPTQFAVINSVGYSIGGAGDTTIGTIKNVGGALSVASDGTRDVNIGSDTVTNAIFVEGSNGRVGINNSTPGRTLDVRDANNGEIAVRSTSAGASNTAGVYVDGYSSNTSGATANGGAQLSLQNNDTTSGNFNAIRSIDAGGQVTSAIMMKNISQTNNDGNIEIYSRPSGGSLTRRGVWKSDGGLLIDVPGTGNALEVSMVDNQASAISISQSTNEYFVIDTTDFSESIQIAGTAAADLLIGTTSKGTTRAYFEDASNARMVLSLGTSTTAASTLAAFKNPNGTVGTISTNGTATAYNTSSDYRLKENVVPMLGAADRVKLLKPVNFNFIADPETAVDGFLAHELAEVIPEAVTGDKDAVDEDNNPIYQGIDQSKVVPLLTAALQEALDKIEDLEARISALEAQ